MFLALALLAPLVTGHLPPDECYLVTNERIEVIPCEPGPGARVPLKAAPAGNPKPERPQALRPGR
ncbi:MAG TPA: hypothetical protein VMG32_08900, partial [Anaeromyxobacteraceae bacterium]|nr:hypothetical protein [Anaeromyxobacteraceae bacterium]